MRELRALVVGAGSMGRNHLRTLCELAGVTPSAVVDPGIAGPRLEGVPVVADVASVSGHVDCAVLAAPSALHEPLGRHLAALGVPTLVEKPVALSVEAGLLLTSHFSQARVLTAAGHLERFNPAIEAVRDLLAEGAVGEPTRLSTRRSGPMPDRPMPVGATFDLAVHDLDLVHWLLGAQYDEVESWTRTGDGRPCEDAVTIRGWVRTAEVAALEVTHHASRLAPARNRSFSVEGTAGRVDADLVTGQVRVAHGAKGQCVHERATTGPAPLTSQLRAWCARVRGDRPDGQLATLSDGLRAVAVASAAMHSAQLGGPVRITEEAA